MMLFPSKGSLGLQSILLLVPLMLQLVAAQGGPDDGFNTLWGHTIVTSATYGTSRECKTCPWDECISKYVYEAHNRNATQNENITLVCFTYGEIAGPDYADRTWVRTDKDCYAPLYDMVFSDPVENRIPMCEYGSNFKNITTLPAKIKYHAECDLNPNVRRPESVTMYYPATTHVVATCWTEGGAILDDPVYIKTIDSCFVGQIMLTHPIDKDELPNCGPVAHRQINGTGGFEGRRRSLPPAPVPAPAKLSPRYLINVTVGEDWAKCRELPAYNSTVVRAYPWDEHVIIQCTAAYDDATSGEYESWGLTTDFCYVNGRDFWESITGDFIYMPRCSNFGVP